MQNKLKDLAQKLADLAAEYTPHIQTLGKGINDVNLAPNFKLREFECKHCGTVKIDPELVRRLQVMRDEIGKPIIINSGYRCPEHNRAVGGAAGSQHLYGTAADIVCPGASIQQVRQAAEKHFKNGGIGRYNTYTHVDTGPKRRWTG
ncbi:MAG TPA: DUF882 domain-containing protein [Clostridiaceae bacterium]|nr:DUF882 domain-containing protein [Clostridiaceae bacterium]